MEKPRIQDDLYNHVNGEWIEQAVIPADKPCTGGFSIISDEVEKTMIDEFKQMSKTAKYPNTYLERTISLFNMVMNETKRNKQGIKPVLKTLNKIEKINDLKGLNRKLKDFVENQINLPFDLTIEIDMKDTSKYCVMISPPSIILPDTTFYQDETKKNQYTELWKNMASNILKETSLSETDQITYINDTLKFDELIAKYSKSNEEKAEYVKLYNPINLQKACSLLRPLKFKKLVTELFETVPEYIVASEPRFFKAFREIFNEETFILYKHWAYVTELIGSCSLLSEKLRELGGSYQRAITGVAAMPELSKYAYQLSSSLYSEPVGIYYGEKYFGNEAKNDVIEMVKEIIETYKKRVANSDILQEETKKKAISKLSTMKIKMGYPDKVHEIFDKLVFDKNDSLYEAVTSLRKIKYLDKISKLNEPTDPTTWAMPGHMVNACYSALKNDITFPAAILQAPFYSIKQSRSQNLGGIGAVIGHEISHAFDNNGALFDEKGSLSNWWTKLDFAKFKQRTKAMIKQFDGIELPWGKVNGTFIVSENIADNGGMAVTLDIMSSMKDANYEDYFTNWAKIWCMKAKEEYLKMLLAVDCHGPKILRANMPPRNFDAWYNTYNVTKKDKMYIEPKKRIVIW